MNILFLTIGRFESIETHAIYPDLLRQFRNNGHKIVVVSQREKREGLPTEYREENGISLLKVCIGNITKCGMIEKGISTLEIEYKYKIAINKYLSDINFDLVLYSTPPITLAGVVKYIKKRDGAKTYLLLKDIFPQNAVDLGIIRKTGIKGLLYKFFRKKEKELYWISDYIGCMSQANVEYLLKNNNEIIPSSVEICPNSIEPLDMSLTNEEKIEMRLKYNLPLNKKIFVYGGNLGKPQGITFLIECLKTQKTNTNIFFLIVGDGTEYGKLLDFTKTEQQTNVKLMNRLPKEDYDRMIAACDIGMIFLDKCFTIPNIPSRMLAYMQAKLPILAVTDKNTDVGRLIVDGGFGWWMESHSTEQFYKIIDEICQQNLHDYGNNAWTYLNNNFTSNHCYKIIMKHFLR